MPFAPEVQQLIQQVEEISGLPVHVTEEPGMKVRATVVAARRGAPAHFIRFRSGSANLDYLLASQLLFLHRSLSLPASTRWEIGATPAEQDIGIKAMGLDVFNDEFARAMIGQIITQTRSYPIGFRVDDWIWEKLPACARNWFLKSAPSSRRTNGRSPLRPAVSFPKGSWTPTPR